MHCAFVPAQPKTPSSGWHLLSTCGKGSDNPAATVQSINLKCPSTPQYFRRGTWQTSNLVRQLSVSTVQSCWFWSFQCCRATLGMQVSAGNTLHISASVITLKRQTRLLHHVKVCCSVKGFTTCPQAVHDCHYCDGNATVMAKPRRKPRNRAISLARHSPQGACVQKQRAWLRAWYQPRC